VRVWNITKRNDTSMLSPTTVRKRITVPSLQARRLEFNSGTDEPATSSTQQDNDSCTAQKPHIEPSSPGRNKSPDLRTPESVRKRPFFLFESEASSPSSVLSPPPSLKRKTIRDYFASASKNGAPSSP
jgi:denticleless